MKATSVDFTSDYSNKSGSTYHLAHLAQGGNTGTKETSTLTKTFEFDNRSGSSAQTKTWALLLTHVVKNTSESTHDCHQWGSFKNSSYSWATYYYKYVTFNSNGGTGTMSQQTVVNSANLTANAFTRVGYTFAGWATSQNGDVVYANGAGITATSNSKGPVTLYAKWTPITYTVRFNKNATDATGTMSNETFTYDTPKALPLNAFTRTGYTFAGWALTKVGNVVYTDGQAVSNLQSTQGTTVDLYGVTSKTLC